MIATVIHSGRAQAAAAKPAEMTIGDQLGGRHRLRFEPVPNLGLRRSVGDVQREVDEKFHDGDRPLGAASAPRPFSTR